MMPPSRKPTVLVDCDGVLADFIGGYLDLVKEFTGTHVSPDLVTCWDIHECDFFKEFPPHTRRQIDDAITERPGWCLGLKPYAGAREGLDKLREIADVHVATSPWHSSPFWMHERVQWLKKHMGVPVHRVMQGNDKKVFWGHALLDDKPDNLVDWPHGMKLLWDLPNNRGTDCSVHLLHRVSSWDHVVRLVRAMPFTW